MKETQSKSLEEVHESVAVKNGKFKRIISFFGPAYLVSVGYMDPGNWATDLAGGSKYGYTLLWVLLMSNLMALFLQSLCARLGIVRKKDLAQCNKEIYPKGMNFILYILAEIAIIACELAEILGMAIGLKLLFGIDLIYGVIISFLDTFLLLYLQKLGMRKMELFIVGSISIIAMCFLTELILAKPQLSAVVQGFIPNIPDMTALYISIGMIGATVMPHNLYLHSALVQTRKIDRDEKSLRKALKYNFFDSAIALNIAFFVNAAILILAASAFHINGHYEVAELEDAHKLLGITLGTNLAPKLFAVALILAGQSSTVTGTLAGQIVMEGYLNISIPPVYRRIITRFLAVAPAVIVILIFGDSQVGKMLVFSQVLLSMQLAFAIIPLIYFVSDKKKMGTFAIGKFTKVIGWGIAAIVSFLNIKLVYEEFKNIINENNNVIISTTLYTIELLLLLLLFFTISIPLLSKKKTIE